MRARFTAVFVESAEGGFIGYVEEFPDVRAQGATLEEARNALRDALGVVLALNRQRNRESFRKYRPVGREPFQGASWRSLKHRKPSN